MKPIFASRSARSHPLIIGHRGSRLPNSPPENTLPAFQQAIELGAEGIELDIRLTRDDQLAVYHDSELSRLTGLNRRLSSIYSSELREISFKEASGNNIKPAVRIPLLKEVLQHFGDGIYYNIEIKQQFGSYRLLVEKLFGLIREYKLERHIWVSSFDARFLRQWAELHPRIPTAYLFEKLNLYTRFICRQKYISILHPAISLFHRMRQLESLDKPICFWTVNEEIQFSRLKQANILAVISDNIPLALKILRPN